MKKFTFLTTLCLLLFTLNSCKDSINFEEDISGTWLLTFQDLVDNFDGTYSAGIGRESGADCCGEGLFRLTIDGISNNFVTETSVSSSGKFNMNFLVDNENRGNASGDLRNDGTGDGDYSITWINGQTGMSRVVSGIWTAEK